MDAFEAGAGGFGESTLAELAELRKALDISPDNSAAVTGFDSLRMESLEQVLKVLTFRMEHMTLWRAIRKTQAFSTVEEYNRLESYGAFESGVFVPSGTAPEEQDATYSRQSQKVKYMGTTRIVNHQATLVRTAPADLIAQETQNGAVFLIGKMNEALAIADETIVPQEFTGLTKQITAGAGHVIDLRGGQLTQAKIEEGAQLVVDNYGMPTQMFANPKVFADFSTTFHTFQRFQAPNVASGVVGTPVTGFMSMAGRINFNADTFLRRGQNPPASATSTSAPGAPTLALLVRSSVETVSDGNVSQFSASDAGDYKYQVTAINRYGESAPCTLSAATTVAVNESVRLTITNGSPNTQTGYKIYRTEAGYASAPRLVSMVQGNGPLADSGQGRTVSDNATGTTVRYDVNADLPGTYTALLLDMSEQSLNYRQLSPMIRMPLSVVAPSIRWMQLIYGTPIVYQPARNVIYKNIAPTS
jgi:hypothetical protein